MVTFLHNKGIVSFTRTGGLVGYWMGNNGLQNERGVGTEELGCQLVFWNWRHCLAIVIYYYGV